MTSGGKLWQFLGGEQYKVQLAQQQRQQLWDQFRAMYPAHIQAQMTPAEQHQRWVEWQRADAIDGRSDEWWVSRRWCSWCWWRSRSCSDL